MKSTVSKSVREAALAQLKTAMIEKKLTQSELADAADCHEKTIQNLLGGRSVRDQTLFDVCVVLGLDFEKVRAAWNGGASGEPSDLHGEGGVVAPVYMGAYTRAAVDHYLGSFLTLRPSFSQPGSIVAYRTDITWDAEWPSLLFQERDRPDAPYSHRGRLYIPSSSSFIHLVSLTKGLGLAADRLLECEQLLSTLGGQNLAEQPAQQVDVGAESPRALPRWRQDGRSPLHYLTIEPDGCNNPGLASARAGGAASHGSTIPRNL